MILLDLTNTLCCGLLVRCLGAKSLQSCLTLCDPVDRSLPGSSGKNMSGLHTLLQGIFLTQGSNPHLLQLLHWQAGSLPLCHLGSRSNNDFS